MFFVCWDVEGAGVGVELVEVATLTLRILEGQRMSGHEVVVSCSNGGTLGCKEGMPLRHALRIGAE